MESKLMEKYIRISRIVITILVFIILNIWFIFENDLHWLIAFIISMVVFFINFPSSKICIFFINKGDAIKGKILKLLYYAFALPIVSFLFLIILGLLYIFIVDILIDSINLGEAVLIAFAGLGSFICILVPYFQTLIILILRSFLKLGDKNKN